jgi:membrane protein
LRQFAPIRATRGFFEKNLYINAAAIAFFGVLAFVPTLVLVVLFGGFLLQSHEPLYRTVQNQLAELFPSLPEDFLRISMGFIQNPASIGVSGAVFFFLGFDMLLQALRVSVYKISGEKTKDGFFASRLISLLMIVGLGVTLAVSASAGTITEFVRAFVQERPFVPAWVEKILEFSPTQIALSMGGIAVFLTALLWVLPESRVPFKVALLCGVVGSVLWEAAKKGFTFYVFRIARTSYFYGSLSAMMMFLLWFYYSALLMLWVFELAFELLGRPKSVSAE